VTIFVQRRRLDDFVDGRAFAGELKIPEFLFVIRPEVSRDDQIDERTSQDLLARPAKHRGRPQIPGEDATARIGRDDCVEGIFDDCLNFMGRL